MILFKFTTGPNSAPELSPEQIAMLADMGFTSLRTQARKPLRETGRELSLVLNDFPFVMMHMILYK